LIKNLVSIVSLGCPKNLVDSERILGSLLKNGINVTLDPEKADTIIINTCSFLSSAREEAEGVIEEFIGKQSKGRLKKIIVSGCYPSLVGDELFKKFPQIYSITGTNDINQILKAIERKGSFVSDKPEKNLPPRIKVTLPHYSYLKTADGCNHSCSFCLIPKIKGRLHSLPISVLLDEARALSESSVKELIIIAQDTTQYGLDLYGEPKLVELLENIEKINGISWVRIMYSYPSPVLNSLLDLMMNSSKIVPYLDIPIQHISDRILRQMRRGYTRSEVERVLYKFKEAGIALRTSVIVGFPSETNEEFNELRDFLAEFKFDHLGIFEYSNEAGTLSYEDRTQISEQVKRERFDELVALKESIALKRSRQFLKKEIPFIVDYYEDSLRKFVGRTIYDAPEVDDIAYIKGDNLKAGDILVGKVISSSMFEVNLIPKKE
jgi:ribosomal protein S12 methylthiotransferase